MFQQTKTLIIEGGMPQKHKVANVILDQQCHIKGKKKYYRDISGSQIMNKLKSNSVKTYHLRLRKRTYAPLGNIRGDKPSISNLIT